MGKKYRKRLLLKEKNVEKNKKKTTNYEKEEGKNISQKNELKERKK